MILLKKIFWLLTISIITFIVFDLCVKGIFIGGASVIASKIPILAFTQGSIIVTYIKYLFSLIYLRFVYMFVKSKE